MHPLTQSKKPNSAVLIALIAPVTALLFMLSVAVEGGQMVGNIEVLDGPDAIHPFPSHPGCCCRQLQVRPIPDSAKDGIGHASNQGPLRAILLGSAGVFDPQMANSPSRSSVSTPAAQTAS